MEWIPPSWRAPRRWAPVARLALLFAPAHAALPVGLAWVDRRCGSDAMQLLIVGIHLLFPFIYLLVSERVRFEFSDWALWLGLNHAFVLLGAVPLLW